MNPAISSVITPDHLELLVTAAVRYRVLVDAASCATRSVPTAAPGQAQAHRWQPWKGHTADVHARTAVRPHRGRSSRLLRQEFPSLRSRLPTLWTNSYFVATVGGATLEIVEQYVANQPTPLPPFPPHGGSRGFSGLFSMMVPAGGSRPPRPSGLAANEWCRAESDPEGSDPRRWGGLVPASRRGLRVSRLLVPLSSGSTGLSIRRGPADGRCPAVQLVIVEGARRVPSGVAGCRQSLRAPRRGRYHRSGVCCAWFATIWRPRRCRSRYTVRRAGSRQHPTS